MHIRLVFALALIFVSIFGGLGLQASHGGFCTVGEIEKMYFSGSSAADIEEHCAAVDVGGCDPGEIFDFVDDGYTVGEVYQLCK